MVEEWRSGGLWGVIVRGRTGVSIGVAITMHQWGRVQGMHTASKEC